MLVSSFTPDANFWELNPLFTVAGPQKQIYLSDVSRDKVESSKLMWFVAFCYDLDPKNIFSRLQQDEKHSLVGKDFMDEEGFYKRNKSTLDPIIEFYCKCQDTAAKRQLRVWNLKIDEKTKFMQETVYDEATYQMLEAMMKSNKEIYINYKQIETDLNKEEVGGAVKGGKVESLSDSGQI
jgi:hypothetical protein